MMNHYHLLIETPIMTLSKGVKKLNQQYAQRFNQRHNRVGHLFQGRFKGILVKRETHLLELIRYVVLNPVRCGAVRSAGEYAWSNYRATAGLREPEPWLEINWTLDQFHRSDRHIARAEYQRFVAAGQSAGYRPWDQLVGQIYLGTEAFRERMQEMLKERNLSPENPRRQRKLEYTNFEEVIELVRRQFGTTEEELCRRSSGTARKAVAQLGRSECGLGMRAIGTRLGASDWAVSKLARAGEELEKTAADYRAALDRIRGALS